MDNIAIIPARGGSKRIPRKNIKSFLGKPIIAYSIEAAIRCNLFEEIIVSTDDEEIAEIARRYGAKVPFLRSVKNADDYATTFDVLEEVLKKYSDEGRYFDKACCIYAAAPFVTEEKLNRAYLKLRECNFDCVFPMLQYSFAIQRALKKVGKDGKVEMFSPENINVRSQDLSASFHDSGQFYFFDVKSILREKKLWTDNTGGIEISEFQGQDIDSLIDWKLAELKYKMMIDEEKENYI